MMISTKGRYALRVMIDLCERGDPSYIPLKDIAARQDISQKYLESIMTLLSKAGLVDAVHGKNGGYRINRSAGEYTVGGILRQTEGSLAPVACLDGENCGCEKASSCKTLPIWKKLDGMITDYLDSVTLDTLTASHDE